MTKSHQQFGRLSALVLLIVVGVTVGAGPAVALGDTASSTTQAPAAIDDDIEDVQIPDAVEPNESFTVDATAISERDDVDDVCWRFDENETCHDAEATHTFEAVGPHTATLVVTDDSGEQRSTTSLVLATTTPTAALSAPDSAEATTEVQLDASDSTDDHGIESYEWDLAGDGTVDETTTEPELTHTFDSAGSYDVTVTAVDAAGQSDTASATVEVDEDDGVEESVAATFGDFATSTVAVGLLLAIGAVAVGTFLFTQSED